MKLDRHKPIEQPMQQLRRDAETSDIRQARLDHVRAAHHLRRDAETPEVRQARLQQDAMSHQSSKAFGK